MIRGKGLGVAAIVGCLMLGSAGPSAAGVVVDSFTATPSTFPVSPGLFDLTLNVSLALDDFGSVGTANIAFVGGEVVLIRVGLSGLIGANDIADIKIGTLAPGTQTLSFSGKFLYGTPGTYHPEYSFDLQYVESITQVGGGPFTPFVFESRGTGTTELVISDPTLAAAAPEPSTWAMMILGFAGIGLAAIRKRKNGLAFTA
jgi:hypothetical protein